MPPTHLFSMPCCVLNIEIQVLLTVFASCRYQHRVEWAAELMRGQGQEESTVQRTLQDYTKPLEHPGIKRKEEVQWHDEQNSETTSKIGVTTDREEPSAMNGDAGKSVDMDSPSKPSDGPQQGSGPAPLAPNGVGEPVAEAAKPQHRPLPRVPCGKEDVLLPLPDTQPGDGSQPTGLLRASERVPGDEYVLVEEDVYDESEKECAPSEEVSMAGP